MILEPRFTTNSRKKAKKWQSRKDSNLNKMNQNHLCYRYTTGLRTVYNIRLFFENANKKSKKIEKFTDYLKIFTNKDCKSGLLHYI